MNFTLYRGKPRFVLQVAIMVVGFNLNLIAQQTPKSFLAYDQSLMIGYLEYLPPGYDTSTSKFPVIIFLHGGGELGNGSPEDLQKVASWGPPSHIKNGHNMCFTVDGKKECFIVVSPQLMNVAYNWDYVVKPLVDHLLYGPNQYKVDPDRIYLTGLSRGGAGVYNFASSVRNRPNAIAAIAPMSAWSDDYEGGCVISRRKIPVWAFHGQLDHIVLHGQGVTAFNSVKYCSNPEPTAEMIFTTYEGRYHDSWIPAYDPTHTYHNPNVYEWLLTKTRPGLEEDVTAAEEIIDSENSISLYPNPGGDILTIDPDGEQIPEDISILNTNGDVILVFHNTLTIDISELKGGVYMMRYRQLAGKYRTLRFVKI